jgi:hypothetical protein
MSGAPRQVAAGSPVRMEYEDYLLGAENHDGLCLACREVENGGVEPDERGAECRFCTAERVVGFELALVMGEIEIIDREALS